MDGWNTILSFWVSAHHPFSGAGKLLVLGRINPGATRVTKISPGLIFPSAGPKGATETTRTPGRWDEYHDGRNLAFTTWDVSNPVTSGIKYLLTGAGFLNHQQYHPTRKEYFRWVFYTLLCSEALTVDSWVKTFVNVCPFVHSKHLRI